MKRRQIILAVLILTALVLAGCKFQSTTAVKPGGSGDLRTEVGFSAEEKQNMEKQNPSSAKDFCNAQASRPGNITVTEEKRGDETWCVTTASFKNLDQLRQLYLQRKGIQINRLEISGGMFYYDISIDTSSRDSNFSGFTSMTWVLVLPDQSTAQNADEVEGNTLTWRLAPLSGVRNLHAESKISQPASVVVVEILVLVLIIGGGIYVALRQKKQSPN
ncbi:MAG: hypothetical protein HY258_00475 [Chloroflexi bacterium]|nr:hypothetical protein [Chloroflexota bacterium]